MLRELHISNLAIIENIDIDLGGGLNVFTGQTGAGKSLILGALELLLGLRDGGQDAATFVRPGCSEARVSGLFEVAGGDLARRLGEILDQPLSAGEPILITRRVSSGGRSSVSVNGLPATAGMLRQAGQLLVDIHGQHDQQFLLKPANQVAILDSFADAADTRRQFAQTLASFATASAAWPSCASPRTSGSRRWSSTASRSRRSTPPVCASASTSGSATATTCCATPRTFRTSRPRCSAPFATATTRCWIVSARFGAAARNWCGRTRA